MHGLLSLYGIHRVFILGAGFSAPLGMPLTDALLKEVHAVASKKTWYGDDDKPSPNGQADWLLEKISWYFPLEKIDHDMIRAGVLPSGFDIEKFLSYVASASAFVEGTGEKWNEHGDQFTAFLKGWIGEAIFTRQMNVLEKIPETYTRFLRLLEGSLVLTFNWDTVLETILKKQGIKYSYYPPATYKKPIVPIIKLHGSIDWFSLPSRIMRQPWMSFGRASASFKDCYRAKGNLLNYFNAGLTPWVVIPSYDKISQILALGEIWQTPWIYLQDKLEVIVIGFSMRPEDFHSRAFIYPQLVYGSRNGDLKVKVIDLAQDEPKKKEIRDRFLGVEDCQFFFGGFSQEALEFIAASGTGT